MKQKYAFLDRDGTLIYEPTAKDIVPYQVDSIEKLAILPGVIDGLQKLINAGYKLVMVTNQDYLGKPQFPRPAFERAQQKMLKIFEDNGIFFEEIFICPHGPDEGCLCRKPQTGLLQEFFEKNEVDKKNSFMYGDRQTDEEFAQNLGIRAVRCITNGPFMRAHGASAEASPVIRDEPSL